MNRLATFMHISDLHFGTLDPSCFNAANAWWMRFPILDGFLGHSERAIFALDRRFAQLKAENARLIITGDLTTCGKADEFQLFDEYAGADPSVNVLNYSGLRTPGWQERAIPGNHDYWPGTIKIFGAPQGVVYRIFNDLPRISDLDPIGGGYQVRFIWINSDADVGHRSIHRGLARGGCFSHFEKLEPDMPALIDKEIRILCMHHSPTYKAKAPSKWALEMDHSSRERAAKFIIDHRISVVLCGHLHSPPHVNHELAVSGKRHALFLEARCGSTSQVKPSDLLPSVRKKLRSLGILPMERTNALLIHRLVESKGKVHWETEINLLYSGRFAKPPSSPLQNGQDVVVRFRVWP
jgi:predicted phosphohydrolase